uniref:DUF6557 family protein n=1 Tax=Paenibacillus sp. FSL R5-0341 TaxID=2921636 RepID=UPI00403F84CD
MIIFREQIVALCLYEMNWLGFTEEQIKSKTDNLENEKSSQQVILNKGTLYEFQKTIHP